jgi:hypothetical protein
MTATYVAAGAATFGDNATLHPAFPAGIVAGDTIVIVTAIRNTAAIAGDVNTPGGWTQLLNLGHIVVVAQEWDGSFTAPSCVFSGGVAGDTTYARCFALRGTKVSLAGDPVSVTNGSAQNIATPAFTPSRNGSVVLVGGWKQDDWTSVAALAGLTEIADDASVTGNDMGAVLDYVIQTTAAAVGATSFVVTGGAAAVSKGWALGVNAAPVLTVTEQDAFPTRVLLTVTGLTVGDHVSLYRVVDGVRTLVRAGSTDSATDVSFLRVDAELPFGIPVSYVAVVEDMEVASPAVTYDLLGGKVALSDAIGGGSAEAVIMAWPEKSFNRPSTLFSVAGATIADLGDLGQPTSTITFYLETQSARENFEALIATATEGIVQLRSADAVTYDGVDGYFAALSIRERRFSQDGSDKRRFLDVDVAEVSGWASGLEAQGFTLQDIADFYGASGTLADIDADFTSLLDIARADFTP